MGDVVWSEEAMEEGVDGEVLLVVWLLLWLLDRLEFGVVYVLALLLPSFALLGEWEGLDCAKGGACSCCIAQPVEARRLRDLLVRGGRPPSSPSKAPFL